MLERLRGAGGVLAEASTRPSDPVGAAAWAAASGVPCLTADLVEGLGGPLHDVEGVGAPHRVAAAAGDHGADPVRAVGTDVGDQVAALLTEGIEEPLQSGLLPAGCGPHQPAGIVVDHHGQVPLPALVGDLIDPDPPQVGEPVMHRLDVGPDPGDDRADGAPGDPHQLGDRALGALGSQPGDLLVEGVGMPGRVPGPRHRRHRRPMLATADPGRLGLEHGLDRAQVQCPPAAPPLATVIGR